MRGAITAQSAAIKCQQVIDKSLNQYVLEYFDSPERGLVRKRGQVALATV
jgi:hypothetical protein